MHYSVLHSKQYRSIGKAVRSLALCGLSCAPVHAMKRGAGSEDDVRISFMGHDPILRSVLEETAALTGRYSCVPAQDADVVLASVPDAGRLDAVIGDLAQSAQRNPLQVQALVLEKGMSEPDEDALAGLSLAGVFQKPLALACVLDTLATAARLHGRKAVRDLGGGFSFNPATRQIEVSEGKKTRMAELSAREAGFLSAVLDAGGQGLARSRAMTDVWGFHQEAESHAVETAAYRLRQKLEPLGLAQAFVIENGVYFWRFPA